MRLNLEDEKGVEAYLRKKIKALGGECYKFTSGLSGVPDRIVVYKGKVAFVELKRPKGGKLSELQKVEIVKLRKLGVEAGVLHTKPLIDEFITRIERGDDKWL